MDSKETELFYYLWSAGGPYWSESFLAIAPTIEEARANLFKETTNPSDVHLINEEPFKTGPANGYTQLDSCSD